MAEDPGGGDKPRHVQRPNRIVPEGSLDEKAPKVRRKPRKRSEMISAVIDGKKRRVTIEDAIFLNSQNQVLRGEKGALRSYLKLKAERQKRFEIGDVSPLPIIAVVEYEAPYRCLQQLGIVAPTPEPDPYSADWANLRITTAFLEKTLDEQPQLRFTPTQADRLRKASLQPDQVGPLLGAPEPAREEHETERRTPAPVLVSSVS